MGAIEVLNGWEQRGFLDHATNRREFLRFCGRMTVLLGLAESSIPLVAEALQATVSKRRPSVVWFEFQDCAGNTESFTRANSPSAAQAILESISLDYHETLMAAAGHRAEEARAQALEENRGQVIVVVEGSIPTKDDGVYQGRRSLLHDRRENGARHDSRSRALRHGFCIRRYLRSLWGTP